MKKLANKVVVITGGTGVLGQAFVRALASEGATIALLVRNIEKAGPLIAECTKLGATIRAYESDVLDKEALIKARLAINKELGTCDILINGAGGNSPQATTNDEFFDQASSKSFFDLDMTGFNNVYNLNFTGTLLPTQVFAQDLVGKPGSNIINISSMNAFKPLTKIPAYSAAKAAISNFTSWLAVYFAKSGVRVNAIAPGFFATEQNKTLLFNEDGSLTARSAKILNSTPMGRFGVPEELNGTLLWLANSNESGFVTGIVVPVDGGFSAYSGV